MGKKYNVKLSQEEQEELREVIRRSKKAGELKRAYILLGVDESEKGQGMSDKEVSKKYKVSMSTVERLRRKYVKEGLEITLKGKIQVSYKEGQKKYKVTLTDEERDKLNSVIEKGVNAAKIKRAYILLGADEGEGGKQMSDKAICTAYKVSLRTVERLRKRLVTEGFKIALNGKAVGTPRPRKIDGDVEAHLIVLTRSEAPEGYQEWTLRLLADRMVALGHVDSLSHESVRQTLKKTPLNLTNAYVG